MGSTDITLKECLQNNQRYAPLDLIDLIDFSGFEEQEQMIW